MTQKAVFRWNVWRRPPDAADFNRGSAKQMTRGILPAAQIPFVLFQIDFLQFLGGNAVAEHQIVEIHHGVTQLLDEMAAGFRVVHDGGVALFF